MKPIQFAALVLLATVFTVQAQESNDKNCMATECAAGNKAITRATKHDPYYACNSCELAEYTNFVLGLVEIQVQLTGKFPNIPDKTGEPEYQGETKLMLDSLREKAGVTTFDQAVSLCSKGVGKLKVTVLNNPKDSSVIYIVTNQKRTLWLPKSSLDKK